MERSAERSGRAGRVAGDTREPELGQHRMVETLSDPASAVPGRLFPGDALSGDAGRVAEPRKPDALCRIEVENEHQDQTDRDAPRFHQQRPHLSDRSRLDGGRDDGNGRPPLGAARYGYRGAIETD